MCMYMCIYKRYTDQTVPLFDHIKNLGFSWPAWGMLWGLAMWVLIGSYRAPTTPSPKPQGSWILPNRKQREGKFLGSKIGDFCVCFGVFLERKAKVSKYLYSEQVHVRGSKESQAAP